MFSSGEGQGQGQGVEWGGLHALTINLVLSYCSTISKLQRTTENTADPWSGGPLGLRAKKLYCTFHNFKKINFIVIGA